MGRGSDQGLERGSVRFNRQQRFGPRVDQRHDGSHTQQTTMQSEVTMRSLNVREHNSSGRRAPRHFTRYGRRELRVSIPELRRMMRIERPQVRSHKNSHGRFIVV
jgi:hypothetical protein